MKGTHFSPK